MPETRDIATQRIEHEHFFCNLIDNERETMEKPVTLARSPKHYVMERFMSAAAPDIIELLSNVSIVKGLI